MRLPKAPACVSDRGGGRYVDVRQTKGKDAIVHCFAPIGDPFSVTVIHLTLPHVIISTRIIMIMIVIVIITTR